MGARLGRLINCAAPAFAIYSKKILAANGGVADATASTADKVTQFLNSNSTGTAAYRAGRVPERRAGIQLAGRTASILGYGNLGRRMAELLAALGMRVLVDDPNVATVAPPAIAVDRRRALAEGDFVLCLVVHHAGTDQSMNAATFAAMKRSAFFLNPSRGRVVDEAALAAALRDGTIAGAALDVGSDPDDVPPAALGALPNVIATPHVGGMVPEALASQAADTVAQVAAILAGRMPDHALNPGQATRLATLR